MRGTPRTISERSRLRGRFVRILLMLRGMVLPLLGITLIGLIRLRLTIVLSFRK